MFRYLHSFHTNISYQPEGVLASIFYPLPLSTSKQQKKYKFSSIFVHQSVCHNFCFLLFWKLVFFFQYLKRPSGEVPNLWKWGHFTTWKFLYVTHTPTLLHTWSRVRLLVGKFMTKCFVLFGVAFLHPSFSWAFSHHGKPVLVVVRYLSSERT